MFSVGDEVIFIGEGDPELQTGEVYIVRTADTIDKSLRVEDNAWWYCQHKFEHYKADSIYGTKPEWY